MLDISMSHSENGKKFI